MTTIIIEPSMHKGSMTVTNVKKKIYRQKKGISCEKKGLARFRTSKPWKLCPKTWGIIEFQLLHNPICTTKKNKTKRSAKRRPFLLPIEVQKSSDNL